MKYIDSFNFKEIIYKIKVKKTSLELITKTIENCDRYLDHSDVSKQEL